ncbi:MAG: 16S rRNA (uracil(1498)-N(3))-methyltransferase [Lachnospiraceae bacterium]|nr:16S rRNA (uracil(1498)-N(3))-methyltransferase [Lachnospiraceae bacterium]
MLQIFCDASEIALAKETGLLVLRDDRAHHIRDVLRMKPGEELAAKAGEDGAGEYDSLEYRFGIESADKDEVVLRLRFVRDHDTELPVKVSLYQALPKADKMDLIVQKAVELGVCEIIPVESSRCIVKLDDSKKEKRRARWQSIAESAASQCGRAFVPAVRGPVPIAEAFADAEKNADVRVIPYERQEPGSTGNLLKGLAPGTRIAVFIGPEGGFEEGEIEKAREHGIEPVSLGRRILRTETAGMAFLSFLIWLYEVE